MVMGKSVRLWRKVHTKVRQLVTALNAPGGSIEQYVNKAVIAQLLVDMNRVKMFQVELLEVPKQWEDNDDEPNDEDQGSEGERPPTPRKGKK